GRQQPDRRQLLSLKQLLFELSAFGDVLKHHQRAGYDTARGLKRRKRDVQRERPSVFSRCAVFVNMLRIAKSPAIRANDVLDGFYQVRIEDVVNAAMQGTRTNDAKDVFKCAVPGCYASFEINNKDSDVDALDDVL